MRHLVAGVHTHAVPNTDLTAPTGNHQSATAGAYINDTAFCDDFIRIRFELLRELHCLAFVTNQVVTPRITISMDEKPITDLNSLFHSNRQKHHSEGANHLLRTQ